MIDCATKSPALTCINTLVQREHLNSSYHLPSQNGMDGLKKAEDSDIYIIFGSYSNIGDNLPWHADLAQFILKKLKNNKPVLGICFGHQLVCHFLGMKIDLVVDKNEKITQGYRKITFNQSAWGFAKNQSFELFVSHDYEVKGSHDDFLTLASSKYCNNEIICHRRLPFIGVQSHPEGTQQFVNDTLTNLISKSEITRITKSGATFLKTFISEAKKISEIYNDVNS